MHEIEDRVFDGAEYRTMNIGVIGAGQMGGTLAQLFVRVGHSVAISNSRGPETLRGLETTLGRHGRAATPDEAAVFGDVVVVAIPFGRYHEIPAAPLDGKLVVDVNNYLSDRDGVFKQLEAGGMTSSDLLQAHLAGASVVKAFNAIRWTRLRDDGKPAGARDRLAIPIAGDDRRAKQVVAELIDQIGFDPIDAGTLSAGGRRFQRGTPLFDADLAAEDLQRRLASSV